MRTSVGWCAGKPSDHGVPDETDVARIQLQAYPGTTAVREFRTGAPSVSWWSQQTLAACAELAVRPAQFDVALSWTDVQGKPLGAFLDSAPAWVDRIILTGVHEMHQPAKNYTPEKFTADMRWIRGEVPDRMRSRVFLAPCFIYYRSRISAPQETAQYLTPLVEEGLIDAIAWDIYPSNPADVGKPGGPTNPVGYESAGSLLEHARTWAAWSHLPYAILELNYGRRASDPTGRARAALLGDIFRNARQDGALTVCQFHYNLGDLLAESGNVEDDAWAALCREAEAARISYEYGFTDGSVDGVTRYENGRRDAYSDMIMFAQSKRGPEIPAYMLGEEATQ